MIADEANEVIVSAASAWEIATKYRLGKLPEAEAVATNVAGCIADEGFEALAISVADAERAGRLPGHHRDPFDRMIIAQALRHELAIVSVDATLDRYGGQPLGERAFDCRPAIGAGAGPSHNAPREAEKTAPGRRTMKLGMFMHPIQDFRRGYHTLLKEDFEIIKCADAVGFDEVWLGEHFALPSEPIQSPLMLFAALVPQTERIKFGSGVLCLPYQHPAIVAGQAAQFDHISEGRFLMGIGPGATPPDFEMFRSPTSTAYGDAVESHRHDHGIWPRTRPTSSTASTGTSRLQGQTCCPTSASAPWASPTSSPIRR